MLALGDCDLLSLVDGETLDDGLTEGDSELLGLRLALGDGETDDDPALGEGLSLALGEVEALALLEGLREALELALGETLPDGETEADGDTLALSLADGD